MIERIQKIKTRQALEQAKKKKIDYKSPLIISGKRQEYNHHIGQPFSEFDVKKFSSHGWKHPKSKGDYFTIKNHNSVRVAYLCFLGNLFKMFFAWSVCFWWHRYLACNFVQSV